MAGNKGFGKGELFAGAGMVFQTLAILSQRVAALAIEPVLGAVINTLPLMLAGLAGLMISRQQFGSLLGQPTRKAILASIVGALSSGVLALPLFLAALSLGGAVIVAPVAASGVIWAGLLSWKVLGQSLQRQTFLGLVVFACGLVILTKGQASGETLGEQWFWAIPLGLLVALLYGLTMTMTGYSLSKGLSQGASVGISGIVGFLGLGAWLLIQGQPLQLGVRETGMLLLAGVFQALALVMVTAAFARTTVVSVGLIIVTNIVWTSLLSWALLGDTLNSVMAIGLVVILGGLILAQMGRTVKAPESG